MPTDERRRELVAVILRAILMIVRAVDRYFDAGVFRHKP